MTTTSIKHAKSLSWNFGKRRLTPNQSEILWRRAQVWNRWTAMNTALIVAAENGTQTSLVCSNSKKQTFEPLFAGETRWKAVLTAFVQYPVEAVAHVREGLSNSEGSTPLMPQQQKDILWLKLLSRDCHLRQIQMNALGLKGNLRTTNSFIPCGKPKVQRSFEAAHCQSMRRIRQSACSGTQRTWGFPKRLAF